MPNLALLRARSVFKKGYKVFPSRIIIYRLFEIHEMFVNLTLEHSQNARKKIRLSFLAAKHNIPSWLLELRNEATHSFCPSLSMLRMGANTALQHLEKTFWSKEVANTKLKINLSSEREAEIVILINQYKSLQVQRAKSRELRLSLSKDVRDVLKKMGTVILHD
ncbi:hypothetical protein AVEN_269666-1, partial [Araneus ventricosus]